MPPADDVRPGLRRLISTAIELLDRLETDPDAEPAPDDEPEPETPTEGHHMHHNKRLVSAIAGQHQLASRLDGRLIAAEAVAAAAANYVHHPATCDALQALSLALDHATPDEAADFLATSNISPLDTKTAIDLLDALTTAVLAWTGYSPAHAGTLQ